MNKTSLRFHSWDFQQKAEGWSAGQGLEVGVLASPGTVVTSSGSLGKSRNYFLFREDKVEVGGLMGGRTLKSNKSP